MSTATRHEMAPPRSDRRSSHRRARTATLQTASPGHRSTGHRGPARGRRGAASHWLPTRGPAQRQTVHSSLMVQGRGRSKPTRFDHRGLSSPPDQIPPTKAEITAAKVRGTADLLTATSRHQDSDSTGPRSTCGSKSASSNPRAPTRPDGTFQTRPPPTRSRSTGPWPRPANVTASCHHLAQVQTSNLVAGHTHTESSPGVASVVRVVDAEPGSR
jgi:hypothetical protein